MQLEFEQNGDSSTKKASIVPSAEGGVFRVSHEYYGERLVRRIGLAGLNPSVAHEIEAGNMPAGTPFTVADDQTVTFNRAVMDCGTVDFTIPGSGNTSGAIIKSFVELAPMPIAFEVPQAVTL